ncbi:hypothetical protein C4D60_Mb05t30090 [Musa balbisiana]|uniref:Uncharacterized protein n=1 Tax=Musa balbisiana TaxID=52838 RepID=A0A4S8JZV5_MUSBA|nr:hypothetical protein C4D60_Mb05t30090 [Musa balbisiana]
MTRLLLKYDGREAVTDFEPSTHEVELFPEGETEGYAVDLKLSTSQPVVHGPKGYQNLLGIQFEASDVYKATNKDRRSLRFVCKLLKSGVGSATGSPSQLPLFTSAASSGFSTDGYSFSPASFAII